MHSLGIDLALHQQAIDTTTPAGKAMFQMMAVFGEFERSMSVERVSAGVARAKASGTKGGNAIGTAGKTEKSSPVKCTVASVKRPTQLSTKFCIGAELGRVGPVVVGIVNPGGAPAATARAASPARWRCGNAQREGIVAALIAAAEAGDLVEGAERTPSTKPVAFGGPSPFFVMMEITPPMASAP